ncbi:MAG: UbiX family flavin prenyltransferase [Aureliella sp.]
MEGKVLAINMEAPAQGGGALPAFADPPIVLAITGASGAIYAGRLLQILLARGQQVHLTISPSGAAVVKQELDVILKPTVDGVVGLLGATNRFLGIAESDSIAQSALAATDTSQLAIHAHDDYFTPIASGSHLTRAMVICPCSGSTLSGVARSASQNLVQRAAEVHLKEGRKLILVPRETPLSVLQIENMYRLAQAGCVILPAAPGWYHGVDGMIDLVDFVVSRILDQLGVANSQIKRWE